MTDEGLSKNAQALLVAVEKGYVLSEEGLLYNAMGDHIEGYICISRSKRTDTPLPYRVFGVRAPHLRDTSIKVPFHRLQGYQLFNRSVFKPGIVVRHLNGNSLDNRAKNIAIGTQQQNSMDRLPEERVRIALSAAEKQRRWTPDQVRELRRRRAAGERVIDLAAEQQVAKATMSYMLRGQTYRSVT